jgi:hypothetical protein
MDRVGEIVRIARLSVFDGDLLQSRYILIQVDRSIPRQHKHERAKCGKHPKHQSIAWNFWHCFHVDLHSGFGGDITHLRSTFVVGSILFWWLSTLRLPHQLRQPRHVGRNPPCLFFGEQLG